MIADPHRLRSHAKTAVELITCGAMSVEETKQLIRAAAAMAIARFKVADARGYRAAMSIILAAAKMEQDERFKTIDDDKPPPGPTLHVHATLDQVMEARRQALAYEVERFGVEDEANHPGDAPASP